MTSADTPRRSYEEGCLAAHALDLIGDRWALLVARELMFGPQRFAGLRAGLPGLSANILTRRLAEMEAAGVVARQMLPPPAAVQVYALTEAGAGLRGVLEALCRWGAAMPGHDPRLPISPAALMFSMRTMARPATGGLTADFRMGAELFTGRLGPGGYEVARGAAAEPAELIFEGAPNDLAAAVYGAASLAATLALGRVRLTGEPGRGQAFVDHFSLRRAG